MLNSILIDKENCWTQPQNNGPLTYVRVIEPFVCGEVAGIWTSDSLLHHPQASFFQSENYYFLEVARFLIHVSCSCKECGFERFVVNNNHRFLLSYSSLAVNCRFAIILMIGSIILVWSPPKLPLTALSSSGIAMCCGHFLAHTPQFLQRDASDGLPCIMPMSIMAYIPLA